MAEQTSVLKYFPRVLRYLRPYWRLASVAVGVTVVAGLVGLLAPWPLAIVVDNVLGNQPLPGTLQRVLGPVAHNPFALMLLAVVAGLLITLVSNLLSVYNSYLTTSVEQNMVLDLRGDLFRHAQRLSLAFHDQRRSDMLIYVINASASVARAAESAGAVDGARPVASGGAAQGRPDHRALVVHNDDAVEDLGVGGVP